MSAMWPPLLRALRAADTVSDITTCRYLWDKVPSCLHSSFHKFCYNTSFVRLCARVMSVDAPCMACTLSLARCRQADHVAGQDRCLWLGRCTGL